MHLTSVIGVVAISVAAIGQVGTAPQAQVTRPGPTIEEDLRVRFKVVVTANQTVLARVREYLELVVIRNTHLTRFALGERRGTPPELALVLLFEDHPRMPNNRRELGSVNLRLDPDQDIASIEYCLRDCTEPTAEIVQYSATLDDFLQKLDEESAALARRYR